MYVRVSQASMTTESPSASTATIPVKHVLVLVKTHALPVQPQITIECKSQIPITRVLVLMDSTKTSRQSVRPVTWPARPVLARETQTVCLARQAKPLITTETLYRAVLALVLQDFTTTQFTTPASHAAIRAKPVLEAPEETSARRATQTHNNNNNKPRFTSGSTVPW